MQSLGLLNVYSTKNIGDSAIYAAYAHIFNNIQLVSDLRAFKDKSPPGIAYGPVSAQCDAYLSVGGDIFNNARPWLVTRRFIGNLRELSREPGERTFVFGQSIPPSCRGIAFQALARALRPLSSVHVRDHTTYARLRAAGVKASLSYDAVFGLKATPQGTQAARTLCAAEGIVPEKCALLSLRGFAGMYGYTNRDLLPKLQTLAHLLAERGHLPVFVLQSRVDSRDDDLAIARALAQNVRQARILDLTHDANAEAWDIASAILARARIVVAVRYHTAVLRMLSGRCAYNIFYSNKGADLVSRLAQPGISLDAFDPAQAMSAIEHSADQEFDIATVREQVTTDLRCAYRHAVSGQIQSNTLEQKYVV